MLITGILQLLVIGIKATATENIEAVQSRCTSLDNMERDVFNYITNLSLQDDKFKNSEKLAEYIQSQFGPVFKECMNEIDSIPINHEFEYTEKFFGVTFTIDNFIDYIKAAENNSMNLNPNLNQLIVYREILNILLDNKAIPSVNIGDNKIGLSLNAMINWFFYSLKVFTRNKKVRKLKTIAKFKDSLITNLKDLNSILEKSEEYNKGNSSISKEEIVKQTNDVLVGLIDLTDRMKEIMCEMESIILDETYKKTSYSILVTIITMLNTMVYHPYKIGIPDYWTSTDEYLAFLDNYVLVVNSLLIFSIPLDKVNDIIMEINNNSSFNLYFDFKKRLGRFNIFTFYGYSRDEYLKNHIPELEKTDKSKVSH